MSAVKSLTFISFIFYILVSSSAFIGDGDTFRRKVSLEVNPGWNSSSPAPPGVDLLHVRAVGGSDTLHFLLCSKGAPAVLMVHTNSSQSVVQVNWTSFLSADPSGSLKVEPVSSVQYSTALVFTRLLEFDDKNNTADPDQSSFLPPYDLQDFSWTDLNSTVNYTEHTALLCGTHHSFNNGSLCLQFSAYESAGRDQAWPRLLHSSNSSQLRLWLEGVAPRSNHSRFILELQTVSQPGFQNRVNVKKFIDDEYTPSIFQVSQWVSSPGNSSTVWGYTQWKPVSYRRRVPVLEDATPCRNSEPVSLQHTPPSGLVSAYFTHNPLTHAINVSFSIAGDPFYNTTRFFSWTLLVGMGTPPSDFFSSLVMGIMAVGLGTPLVLIAVGGVYVCVKKRNDPQGYQPIN